MLYPACHMLFLEIGRDSKENIMKIDLKKVLLAGTAVATVGAFTVSQAQAQDITMTSSIIYASSGLANSTGAGSAAANDSIDVNGNSLTVSDGAAAGIGANPNDGGGAGGPFTLGDITDSGAGDLFFLQSAGALTATVSSVAVGDDMTVTNADAADAATTVSVTGATTIADDYTITNNEADNAAGDITVTHTGDLTVTGTTTLTAAGGQPGADSRLILLGNGTFTGGVSLSSNGGQLTTLTAAGTATQTIAGDINGAGANQGRVLIRNTSAAGAVFTGDFGANLGEIRLSSNGSDVNGTIRGNVAGGAIILGNGAGTDTNTLTFSSTGNRTIAATVDGTAGDTDDVVVSGGGITNTTGVMGGTSALDSITISGSSELDADAAITATTVTIGNGSTLDLAGLLTGNVALTGTLQLVTGGGVIGNITGSSGTVDVDNDATVRGSITNVTTVDVADNATLTVDAQDGADLTYQATTTTINDSGTDDGIIFDPVANDIAVQSVIGTATGGQGLIQIADNAGAGTVTFTANVGSAANPIGVFDFAGAGNAEAVSTTGHWYVDTTTFANAGDTFTFLGNGSSQMVSGTLVGTGGNAGDLVFGSGTTNTSVTLMDRVGGGGNTLSDITINPMASVVFASAGNFAGTLINDGTLQVNAGHTLTVGAHGAGTAASGTYTIGIDRTGLSAGTDSTEGTHTGLIAGLGGVDLSNDVLTLNVEGGQLKSEVLDDVITGVTVAPQVTGSPLFSLAAAVDGGNNIDLTVTVASAASVSTTQNNANVLDVILTDPVLGSSTDAQYVAFSNFIQNAPTRTALNERLEQAQPTADGSSFVAATSFVNNSFDLVSDRLASVRTGEATSGMTTGNITQGVRAWMQAFGATGEQDERSGIDGYEFDTYGVGVGIDTENIAEDTVIGVAFSYGDTDSDSDNFSATNTETNSYQFTVYGDHDIDSRTYVNGMFAYTHNEVDTTRTVRTSTANGSFDADQFTFRAEVGRDYEYEGATLTPHALAHWTHYDPDSYTETGAGGAGLVVTPGDIDVVELGLGLDVSWLFRNADGSYFSPVISVGVRHDFADEEVSMTSNFIAGGQSFITNGADPAQTTMDAGVGFTYYSVDNWELTTEYDFEYKEDFHAHAGMLRAAYRF